MCVIIKYLRRGMWKREPDFAPGSGTESGFRLTSGKGLRELQPSGEGGGDSGTSGLTHTRAHVEIRHPPNSVVNIKQVPTAVPS